MAPCGFVYIYYTGAAPYCTPQHHIVYTPSKCMPTTYTTPRYPPTHTQLNKNVKETQITHVLWHLIQVKLHVVHFNITQLILHQDACPQFILHQDSPPPPPQQVLLHLIQVELHDVHSNITQLILHQDTPPPTSTLFLSFSTEWFFVCCIVSCPN